VYLTAYSPLRTLTVHGRQWNTQEHNASPILPTDRHCYTQK